MTINSILNLLDRAAVLENVIPCLGNEKEEDVYKANFLDLKLYFRVLIDDNLSAKVTKDMMKHFRITDLELVSRATRNLKRRFMTQTLSSALFGMTGNSIFEQDDDIILMSTSDMRFGASVMMLADKLDDIVKEKGVDELYVIPSSIHEVLVIPKTKNGLSRSEVDTMICDINEAVVAPDDRLSNHAYIYKKGSVRVEM